jgi:hypothetical protein
MLSSLRCGRTKRSCAQPACATSCCSGRRRAVRPASTATLILWPNSIRTRISVSSGLRRIELHLGNILGRKVDLLTEPVGKERLRTNIEQDRRLVF